MTYFYLFLFKFAVKESQNSPLMFNHLFFLLKFCRGEDREGLVLHLSIFIAFCHILYQLLCKHSAHGGRYKTMSLPFLPFFPSLFFRL